MKIKMANWVRWFFGMSKKSINGHAKKQYSISVIIPAYNEAESIATTIKSVQEQTVPISKIIVVDDCSSDETGKVSEACGAVVVRTSVNQGTKAMAQNYVIGLVDTELVATIDADTRLDKDAIKNTLSCFNDEKTASVCGFVIPQKIETIWEKGRYIEYLFGISLFKAAQNHIGAVMISSGCFSVFRTGILQKLGGFKQRTMAEDMDFTWEAALSGYHIYCVSNSYCYPLDPPTFNIFVKQIKRWYASFFQNISIYRTDFRKKIRLGFIVYGSLVDSIISPFLLFAYFYFTTGSIWKTFAYGMLFDFLIMSVFCLSKAVQIGMVKKTIVSLPSYFIIRPVNMIVFWYCLWNEWIVGNRLSSWEKGH